MESDNQAGASGQDQETNVPDHGHGREVRVEMGRVELECHEDRDAALATGLHEYAIRPDNIDVNALLAGVYYAKGDLGNARMHLVKSRRTGSKDAFTLCVAGLVSAKSGDAKVGKALISEAFERDPQQMHACTREAKRML